MAAMTTTISTTAARRRHTRDAVFGSPTSTSTSTTDFLIYRPQGIRRRQLETLLETHGPEGLRWVHMPAAPLGALLKTRLPLLRGFLLVIFCPPATHQLRQLRQRLEADTRHPLLLWAAYCGGRFHHGASLRLQFQPQALCRRLLWNTGIVTAPVVQLLDLLRVRHPEMPLA